MPGVNLIRNSGAADVFKVAGVSCPGIATVTGCVDESKLDVVAGSGTKGATIHYKGGVPKAFKVELHLMEEDDYDEWLNGEARRILLAAPIGKDAKAFAVDHPSCLECNITAALKQSVSQAEKVGDGSWKVMIELMPSTPPKPSSGTPTGSKTKWTAAPPKDSKTEAEKTLDALVKQAQAGS